MMAANRRQTAIINLLLNNGADVNQVNTETRYMTALSYYKPLCISDLSYTVLLSFLERGACLSYLAPRTLYKIIVSSYQYLICSLLKNGAGPIGI